MMRRIAFLAVVAVGLLASGWLALSSSSLNFSMLAANDAPAARPASEAIPAVDASADPDAVRTEHLVAMLRRSLQGQGACESEAAALNRIQIATEGWDLTTISAALQLVAAEPSCEAVNAALRWANVTAADAAVALVDAGAKPISAALFGRTIGGHGGPGYRQQGS